MRCRRCSDERRIPQPPRASAQASPDRRLRLRARRRGWPRSRCSRSRVQRCGRFDRRLCPRPRPRLSRDPQPRRRSRSKRRRQVLWHALRSFRQHPPHDPSSSRAHSLRLRSQQRARPSEQSPRCRASAQPTGRAPSRSPSPSLRQRPLRSSVSRRRQHRQRPPTTPSACSRTRKTKPASCTEPSAYRAAIPARRCAWSSCTRRAFRTAHSRKSATCSRSRSTNASAMPRRSSAWPRCSSNAIRAPCIA